MRVLTNNSLTTTGSSPIEQLAPEFCELATQEIRHVI